MTTKELQEYKEKVHQGWIDYCNMILNQWEDEDEETEEEEK